ncbi:MAG: hypothetical protein IT366_24510 [Candidatus Hydrogenedentes bacterium]|nr:hypothetical protein [Candidatus Hydrogenedentota bacterium]
MSGAAIHSGLRRPQYAGFLRNEELERLALDELRQDVYYVLRTRSLTTEDWRGVRERAGAAGLEISEMGITQLRALVSELEAIAPYKPAGSGEPPKKRETVKKEKPFGWALK